MREQAAWAYLNRVVEGPHKELTALLKSGRGPEEIAHGIAVRASWVGEVLLSATESRAGTNRASEDLERAAAVGARIIYPGHEEWPVEQFDHAFGFAATGMSPHVRTYASDALAPHALWVRGGSLRMLVEQSVAIVGTRAITRYGYTATRALVQGLSANRWTIISGGALGVDSVAHEAALAAGGATVAVAACGVDRMYPARNARLFDRIVAHGALVSEYPPGASPHRHRFLTRNRLVAALSQGTVVVEAGWRSGALNTLSWAAGLGRIAMAVPGPITGVGSLGCHERIRTGAAQLVVSADDIRGLLSAVGALDVEEQYEMSFAPDAIQALSRNELRVYDALPVSGARKIEGIAGSAGFSVELTVHLLVALMKKGLVVRDGEEFLRVV